MSWFLFWNTCLPCLWGPSSHCIFYCPLIVLGLTNSLIDCWNFWPSAPIVGPTQILCVCTCPDRGFFGIIHVLRIWVYLRLSQTPNKLAFRDDKCLELWHTLTLALRNNWCYWDTTSCPSNYSSGFPDLSKLFLLLWSEFSKLAAFRKCEGGNTFHYCELRELTVNLVFFIFYNVGYKKIVLLYRLINPNTHEKDSNWSGPDKIENISKSYQSGLFKNNEFSQFFNFTSLLPITKLFCGCPQRNYVSVGTNLFFSFVSKYPWIFQWNLLFRWNMFWWDMFPRNSILNNYWSTCVILEET